MMQAITWFEIPVADMDRAQVFYETVLARKRKYNWDRKSQVLVKKL